jgi:pimeloyl-ACP methyl ester carboxylesterase
MRETALRFGASRTLAGVLTEGEASIDGPAVLFLNAGLLHHVGPNRLYVSLARRLAKAGLRSLRFDLSGIGDSGPRQNDLGRDESMISETQEAMDALATAYGVDRFVLFGICSGSDQAVRVALADARVVGAVLVDGYAYQTVPHVLRYYLARLARPHSWWNVLSLQHPAFHRQAGHRPPGHRPPARAAGAAARAPSAPEDDAPAEGVARPGIYVRPPRAEAEARLRALVDRGCRLCVAFTPTTRVSSASQFGEMFPSLRRHPAIRVTFLKGSNHVFTLLASQQALMRAVESWMTESFAPQR